MFELRQFASLAGLLLLFGCTSEDPGITPIESMNGTEIGLCVCPNGTCDGCEVVSCLDGYADCNSDPGCETNLDTDSDCGSCGNVCSAGDNIGQAGDSSNAPTSCAMGTCCPEGTVDLDGDSSNGCEAPVWSPDSNPRCPEIPPTHAEDCLQGSGPDLSCEYQSNIGDECLEATCVFWTSPVGDHWNVRPCQE